MNKSDIIEKIETLKSMPVFKKRFLSKDGYLIPIRLTIIKSNKINACVYKQGSRRDVANMNVNSSYFGLTENQKLFIIAHEMTHILHRDYSFIGAHLPIVSRIKEKRADITAAKVCRDMGIDMGEIIELFKGPQKRNI